MLRSRVARRAGVGRHRWEQFRLTRTDRHMVMPLLLCQKEQQLQGPA